METMKNDDISAQHFFTELIMFSLENHYKTTHLIHLT